MPAIAQDDPAANGVPGGEGEYAREAGTTLTNQPTDPATGKPLRGNIKAAERSADAAALAAARRGESHAVVDAVADAAYIAALNQGAKAGAKAGGIAGTIKSQP